MSRQFLIQALKQATLAQGFCAPNPAVGAVLVKNNKILAKGYHRGVGTKHAEVDALEKYSGDLKDATLFVTLEPCSHYGRTPPCTDMIIARGVSRVFYGYKDPQEHTDTSGEAVLRSQGIDCQQISIPEIDAFYQSYHHFVTHRKPFVTAKLAMSLDSKIAGIRGEPIRITGDEARQFTHQKRQHTDAILTTVKTILADDPHFNARLPDKTVAKPLYILDRQLQLPETARIMETAKKITVFFDKETSGERRKNLEKKGVRCVPVVCDNNVLNLHAVLERIGSDGMHDLWIEAGGMCFSAFAEKKLLQRALLYVAPITLGKKALSAFSSEFSLLKDASDVKWHALGRDVCCEIVFVKSPIHARSAWVGEG